MNERLARPADESQKPPNPGSDEARRRGCICAVMDNNRGKRAPWPPDGWWVTEGCPLHWKEHVDGSADSHDEGTQGSDLHEQVRDREQANDDDLVDAGDLRGVPDGDGEPNYNFPFPESPWPEAQEGDQASSP